MNRSTVIFTLDVLLSLKESFWPAETHLVFFMYMMMMMMEDIQHYE